MGKQAKTLEIIAKAWAILAAHHPMTVRQVYYQLVSRLVIKNNRGQYQAVSNALVDARKDGAIPWDWVEDRLRQPRSVAMWGGVADFADTARQAYRLDVWQTQTHLVEVWLEKDALSGIFEDILEPYGVTLQVGRGYDGWDSIHNAAQRYSVWDKEGSSVTVLYFGDFDPSGDDMVRSLGVRFGELGAEPEIIKCALTRDDIERYRLPPDYTKPTDTRQAAFVARNGDISVELDALPIDVLQERLEREVSDRLDLDALAAIREQESNDRARIVKALAAA